MDIKVFESEQHRFAWLTQHITEVSSTLKSSRKSVENLESFVVATSFIRLGLSYAKALVTLIKEEQAEATPPLHRSIYELWIELSFLFRSGNPEENAARFSINTVLEMEDFIEQRKSDVGDEAIAGIQRTISSYEVSHPEIMDAIREQRRRRHFHWSGISRSRMEREVAGHDTSIYKVMSWEAHVVLSPMRDLEMVMGEGNSVTLKFEPCNTPMVDPEFIAYSAGGILFFMWNEYAKYFELPLVELRDE
jgi:hypothetical protein